MEQPHSTLLMSRLKHEMHPLHVRIEKLPFITALSCGALPLASYVNQLRLFAAAFEALDQITPYINQIRVFGNAYRTLLLETAAHS